MSRVMAMELVMTPLQWPARTLLNSSPFRLLVPNPVLTAVTVTVMTVVTCIFVINMGSIRGIRTCY